MRYEEQEKEHFQGRTHFTLAKHFTFAAGLTRHFNAGVIYCSPITANLLRKDMGLPAERVIELDMDIPIKIDGVEVTLMDANHCPGACMMLFKVPCKGQPNTPSKVICMELLVDGNLTIRLCS